MTYAEWPPDDALVDVVECYWVLQVPGGGAHRVLPDGAADWLFVLDGAITAGPASNETRPPGAYLVGAMTTAAVPVLAPGTELFAVRFQPGGLAAALEAPIAGWTDRTGLLSEALGAADVPGPASVRSATSHRARRHQLNRWLRRRRAAGRLEKRERLRRGLAIIRAEHGDVRVGDLARAVGWSSRHLLRRVRAATGLTPRQLGRIARLRHALERARAGTDSGWAACALAAGYADQAHLVREAQALAGQTPGQRVPVFGADAPGSGAATA
jgi:AraC-like DNA-binding protein